MYLTDKVLILLLSFDGYRDSDSVIEDEIDSVVTIFAENLRHSDKGIRVSTLRILCHYKYLGGEIRSAEHMAEKRRKTEFSYISNVDSASSNVCILYSELLSSDSSF